MSLAYVEKLSHMLLEKSRVINIANYSRRTSAAYSRSYASLCRERKKNFSYTKFKRVLSVGALNNTRSQIFYCKNFHRYKFLIDSLIFIRYLAYNLN